MSTAAPAPQETVRIIVYGFVQGVSYRRWLQGEAEKRELHGWVRNRADGTVEAVIHGAAREVDDLVRACRHGPALARVDRVVSAPAEFDGVEGFRLEASV